jgi:DNA-binding winged helix-turn-helix (wHTH) protein
MADPVRFGRFEVQPDTRRLLEAGAVVALGQRSFDLLLALIERRDRVVTKAELLDVVWPGLVVEENNLQVQVSALRKVLGPQAIATIPGRGYRFAARGDVDAAPQDAGDTREVASRIVGNLPHHLPPLYGRETELKALGALVMAHRLVTVVGAGGIGKSRLALACAHSRAPAWPDGVWMIELAGISEPALLANTVAQTLGVRSSAHGLVQADVVAALAGRHALLILDNCEHLLDAVASLTAALLGHTDVNVLATTQEPLRLADEQQYRLTPLDGPGGVALFEARCAASTPVLR